MAFGPIDEPLFRYRQHFVDDVEWILEKTPSQRQILLFSATMPADVKRIAIKHLNEPEQIKVKSKTSTSETVTTINTPITSQSTYTNHY